jgi:hypothetical protein
MVCSVHVLSRIKMSIKSATEYKYFDAVNLTSGQLKPLAVLRISFKGVPSDFSAASCVNLFSFRILLNTPLSSFESLNVSITQRPVLGWRLAISLSTLFFRSLPLPALNAYQPRIPVLRNSKLFSDSIPFHL